MNTATDTLMSLCQTIKQAGRTVSREENGQINDLLRAIGDTAASVKARDMFRALGWTERRHYVSIEQSMFMTQHYSKLSGEFFSPDAKGPSEGFYVLEVKEWSLQIQEKDERGYWCMVYRASFARKVDALADAARQGIEPDYISHHADHVRGHVIGLAA